MTQRCILVTGSRAWTDVWAVKDALDAAVAETAADGVTELIVRHGACYPIFNPDLGRLPFKSADYLTHLWIARYAGEQPITITEQARPADWTGPCRPSCNTKPRRGQVRAHRGIRGDGKTTCPAAGIYRNMDMVLEQPQPYRGLAFLLDKSSGTSNCVKKMREFSIPVVPIERTSR